MSGSDGQFTVPAGDPGALYRLADELDGHIRTVAYLSADGRALTSRARTNANWSGGAADAYSTFTQGLAGGMESIPAPLASVSSAIRRYAGILQAAQEQAQSASAAAQQASANDDSLAASITQDAQAEAAAANSAVETSAEETRSALGQAVEALSRTWEKAEPVRAFIEKLHAPWDAVGADLLLENLIEKGESVTEAVTDWTREMPQQIDGWWSEVSSLAHDADSGLASWDDVASAADAFTSKVGAATAFAEQWTQDTKWIGTATAVGNVARYVLGGTAIVGDVATIYSPPDEGVMGNVDRGVAGVNAALVAANLFTDEIPVVGEVTMVATGVYLGGDYLYHHWPVFHDTCNTVGHTVAATATAVGHGVASAAKAVGDWF